VRTSVVVPAYQAWATLPLTLAALEPQIVDDPEREVLVVDSTGASDSGALAVRWPWARFLFLPERKLPGGARNLGVAETTGELLAFTDADAVPAPDWLDRLEEALREGFDVAAGAVVNGTPRSLLGTAGYLLEFSEWLPGSSRRTVPHGATCNLIVRRSWFERGNGFREDVWPGEDTILTSPEGRAGRIAYVPAARISHLNRTGARAFLHHQQRLGEAFVRICAAVPFRHAWARRPLLAPLAACMRLAALVRRAPNRDRLRALALLPLLLVGLVGWASGIARAQR
jgi:glycosyltransferase involved in cell wall biosynthesis